MSHTSRLPRAACLPSTTRQPSTPLSLLTTSWKTLNQEQLALETWTCKDPLCQRAHHLTLTGYLSTPSTKMSQDLKLCPRKSSEDGSETILMPQPCMAVSLRLQHIL